METKLLETFSPPFLFSQLGFSAQRQLVLAPWKIFLELLGVKVNFNFFLFIITLLGSKEWKVVKEIHWNEKLVMNGVTGGWLG